MCVPAFPEWLVLLLFALSVLLLPVTNCHGQWSQPSGLNQVNALLCSFQLAPLPSCLTFLAFCGCAVGQF